nr:hypothetical protein [Chromobacterium sp. ASV5]
MQNNTMARLPRVAAGGLTALLLAGAAQAADMNITAEFKPSVLAPQRNQFVNTTKQAGFCISYPDLCISGLKAFTLDFPIGLSYGAIKAKETNPRRGAYIKVPSAFRNVTVTNAATGQRATLRFRISAFASRYELQKPAWEIVGLPSTQWVAAHPELWGGNSWTIPGSPCVRQLQWGMVSTSWAAAVWGYPEGVGACGKLPVYAINGGMTMSALGLMYEMEAPDPLKLDNGKYTGNLTYTIGPNQDFDFGDNATVSPASQKINFELTVEHELKVNYPENSRRVLLEPPGGWQAWLQQGRPATGLLREVPFSIASSGNFSVRLECQYRQGSDCGIANSQNTVTPVKTALSVEGARVKSSGANAEKVTLSNAAGGVVFSSRFLSAARRSRLHFSVAPADAAKMARRAGDVYRGTITVIFDASAN